MSPPHLARVLLTGASGTLGYNIVQQLGIMHPKTRVHLLMRELDPSLFAQLASVEGQHTGTINFGAPVITAGGLIFTAGTSQPLLFAIDKATGKQVWQGDLPVSAFSTTPMTYEIHGRQFVVVDAGGHGGFGTALGDSVVAFALK